MCMHMHTYLCDQIQGNSSVQSWIKSIDIRSLSSNNKVVANSKHPITMDANTANVSFIQEKLSREAFGGSSIKLLNSKNIIFLLLMPKEPKVHMNVHA